MFGGLNKIDNNKKKELINGPVCVYRITNGEKIIYLFGDHHIELTKKTECNPKSKKDLIDYIEENVKNNNIIDIMIENYANSPKFTTSYISDNSLIAKMNEFISKNVILDKQYHKNINKGSRLNNTRFHYIDIRNNTGDEILYELNKYIFNVSINMKTLLYYFIGCMYNILLLGYMKLELGKIFQVDNSIITPTIDEINNEINKLKQVAYNKRNSSKYNTVLYIINKAERNIEEKLYFKNISKLYNKIFKDNTIVKSNLINIYIKKIDTILLEINDILKLIMKNIKNKFNKKIFDDISQKYDFISFLCMDSHTILNDIYTIYRINKQYIKNCVLFTGQMHTINLLIHFLNNGYDITHMSNNGTTKSINEISSYIKNIPETSYQMSYINNMVDKYITDINILSQCVDMSSFPKNFE